MAIVDTLNKWAFVDGFDKMGRGENFTRHARELLFEYYDALSEDLGEDIEYDPIAICVEWSEYSEEELIAQYGEPLEIEPGQYRYIVDMDERGEYRATIYKIELIYGEPEDIAVCKVDKGMFEEGGVLEGIDISDHDDIIAELVDFDGVDIGDCEPDIRGDTLDDVLENLEERSTVLVVGHYDKPDTYLVMDC